jgi:hypothetical protein
MMNLKVSQFSAIVSTALALVPSGAHFFELPNKIGLSQEEYFTVPLVIFFTWTYSANQATSNWTVVPANWRELRAQWEYSHAVNAILTFVALCTVTQAVVLAKPAAAAHPPN